MFPRVVITGIGLTSPIGNDLKTFRENLLAQKSGIQHVDMRHMGQVAAGIVDFDATKYQPRKMLRRGTRAGSIAIYCAHEALRDAQYENIPRDKTGVFLGITEHGNVETEEEIHQLYQNDLDVRTWSHHHNPRTVANSPAGEVTLSLGITGPHYCIGAACAAGNLGPIQGLQMLQMGEVDVALAGGVSESARTFGIFAAFKAQGALGEHNDPTHATKPLDKDRNGIVVSEGGAVFVLERLDDALKRGAKIYGEIIGHAMNSDARDFVLPDSQRQEECVKLALERANLTPKDIDIVSLHATGTEQGDIVECKAISSVFDGTEAKVNGAKGHIGHCMGASGALELAGNIPSFNDNYVHGLRSVQLDERCAVSGLVNGAPVKKNVKRILNNSFGMLGINSCIIVQKI